MFLLLLSLPVLPRHAKMKGPVYQVTKMASQEICKKGFIGEFCEKG